MLSCLLYDGLLYGLAASDVCENGSLGFVQDTHRQVHEIL